MLKTLNISNFRNIQSLQIDFRDQYNWFVGDNGAGKSSILEAISILFTSKSFRTNKVVDFVNHDFDASVLYGSFSFGEHRLTKQDKVGLFKSKKGDSLIKVNGQKTNSFDLIKLTPPLQILANDLINLVDAPSLVRRKIIDWGVFHVKHDFIYLWHQYKKILKQRNAALKRFHSNKRMLSSIDAQLIPVANDLTKVRKEYWESFASFISTEHLVELNHLMGLMKNKPVEIEFFFHQGWPETLSFEEALKKETDKVSNYRFTQSGPHRSDFSVKINGLDAKNYLSRGQKRILHYWFKIMQSEFLLKRNSKKTVFIADDICAELDHPRSTWIFEQFQRLDFQVFGASTENTDQKEQLLSFHKKIEMFHVKHGCLMNNEMHSVD